MTLRRIQLGALILIALAAATIPAAAQHAVPPHAGVWHSDSPSRALAPDATHQLLASLRRITGLTGIVFDGHGRLDAHGPASPRGSALAVDILRRAIASADIFVLENHSASNTVTFGQIEPMDYIPGPDGARVRVWWIRLDFEDFRTIHAPRRVRAAFDPGFVLLHELLHALGHRDGPPGTLGECEGILNEVRAELDLPLRATYGATWVSDGRGGPAQARLLFHDAGAGRERRPIESLFFVPGPGRQPTEPAVSPRLPDGTGDVNAAVALRAGVRRQPS